MVGGAAAACYCGHSPLLTRFRFFTVRAVNSRETQTETESASPSPLRSRKLAQLDEQLRQGNDKAALSLVRDLQGQPGGLQCFGAARQVPQRLYTLDELKLNGIDASSFLAPVDQTLGSIERILQIALALGGVSARFAFDLSQLQLLFIIIGLLLCGLLIR